MKIIEKKQAKVTDFVAMYVYGKIENSTKAFFFEVHSQQKDVRASTVIHNMINEGYNCIYHKAHTNALMLAIGIDDNQEQGFKQPQIKSMGYQGNLKLIRIRNNQYIYFLYLLGNFGCIQTSSNAQ